MELPILNEFATSQDVDEVFSGYNHNIRIENGEFFDMKNLTSDYYPTLSPRNQRGIFTEAINAQGIIAKEDLWWVDGTDICRKSGGNIERVNLGLSELAADCPKRLVSMGAYIIILPDKKYLNTANTADYGDIEKSFSPSSAVSVTFSLTRIDGTAVTVRYRQATQPTDADNGDYWIDTSSVPHTLKRYASTTDTWANVLTTYVKISATNLGKDFEQYDGVTLSGIKDTGSEQTLHPELDAFDGNFTIWDRGNDYIVVIGMLDQTVTVSKTISVKRQMPIMDFVIESQNRLWGCRYGLNNKGDFVNEIYASKLGDFKNWNTFMNISTDSYVASCGTDGEWTGAFSYLGYPIFFKETCIHKVFGNYPANFQIQDTACRGVQRGSDRSLAMVNEVLFYKSRTGVCAFNGSLPEEISEALGNEQYTNAVGGGYSNKYYISMADKHGVYHLFYYDVQKNIWIKEDNTQALCFTSFESDLFFVSGNKIISVGGTGEKEQKQIKWLAESGLIGTYLSSHKYISKMTVRMSLAFGSRVDFFIQYDSIGDWEHCATMTFSSLKSFSVPIRPKRCDHFRIRIVGTGEAKIFRITRTIEEGSDG